MHDFAGSLPLILTDEPKSPNLVKLIPSIEFNFWLKIFFEFCNTILRTT